MSTRSLELSSFVRSRSLGPPPLWLIQATTQIGRTFPALGTLWRSNKGKPNWFDIAR
jgi:hypothetical protein